MLSRRQVGEASLKALGLPMVPSNKVKMKKNKTKQKIMDKTTGLNNFSLYLYKSFT